ncbi:MAG: hypothetical protein ACO3UU_05885 [Minisyncoccia bacterium]
MTINIHMFSNIVNIERTKVFHRATSFANQQESWGELKKNIYIALMSYLAGMGYISGLDLLIEGAYNVFLNVSSNVIPRGKNFVHGGMPYNEAHDLITNCLVFQEIDS